MRKIYNNEELSRIVDRLSETVNSRMDITANNSSGTAYINMRTVSTPPPIYPVESGYDVATAQYYRIYSDGYVEMWGRIQTRTLKVPTYITLARGLLNTDSLFCTFTVENYTSTNIASTDDVTATILGLSTTQVIFMLYDSGRNVYTTWVRYKICGYVA